MPDKCNVSMHFSEHAWVLWHSRSFLIQLWYMCTALRGNINIWPRCIHMTNVLYQSYYFTWECPRKVLTYFNSQAFKWIIILSLPKCQLETVVIATFVITKVWLWELFNLFWAKRCFSLRKKGPMRESRKGNTPKTFCRCGSLWLGWTLLVAEEILKSKYLHEMHLLWMEESPVSLFSHWPLCKTLAPSHRHVLPCLQVFAIRVCDGTSARQRRVQPTALNWLIGSWTSQWELACEMATGTTPILLPTP